MSNAWDKFKNFTAPADAFNDVVEGGGMLGVGAHEVTIQTIELGEGRYGNAQLIVEWADMSGATIRDYVNILNKEGTGYHFTFQRLLSATCSDANLRLQFVQAAQANPSLFQALTGCAATVKVGLADTGYTIKDSPDGGKVLWDVATDAVVPDSGVYADYKEAKEAAEGLGLPRAFPRIKGLVKNTGVTENDAKIHTALQAAASGTNGAAGNTGRVVGAIS